MIKARHIYFATLLIMAFTTLFTVECRAAVLEQAAGYDVTHHATPRARRDSTGGVRHQ